MEKSKIQKIRELVEASQGLPNALIEYNMELPQLSHITKDSFYGVKAVFNKNVSEATMAVLTYKF